MLSRSCQHFTLVGKQRFGSFILHSAKQATKPYPLNLCRALSSTANLLSSDDFSDVINDLVKKDDRHHINHAYVQKLRTCNNLNVLEQFCVESRPSNPQEALLILQRLSNLFYTKKEEQIVEFLKSEDYVSSLSTQFLNDEADISCLMEAAICIFNILEKVPNFKYSVDEEAPLNFTLTFDQFFARFMGSIEKKMITTNVEHLNPDTVIAFYRCLENKHYSEIDPDFVGEFKNVLQRKIPDITSTATITSLLTTLNEEHYNNKGFIMLVINKVEELSPNMLLGELVNTFIALTENGYRKHPIINTLSEAIRCHTDILTLSQLERLANCITKFSIYNPRLIDRYCTDLVNSAHNLFRWSQLSTFLAFLTRARVTDEKVWERLVKWMNKASRNASVNELRFCIGPLALMNVDQNLCSSVVKTLVSRMQPTPHEDPLKWLNAVWSVTTLKCLTSKLAESVLNEAFTKELFSKEYKPEEKLFISQKLCQINAGAKFDLKDYRGPFANVKEFSFTDAACQILKYGTKKEKFEEFIKNLNVFIPPKFATSPRYYPEYGTFLDTLLYYNTNASKFDSISSVPTDSKLPLKGLIAVQYFENKHFTAAIMNEDEDKVRLLGTYQMGIRHLNAAGAKVVVFAERELEQIPPVDNNKNIGRIVYIKDKIIKAAQSD